MSTPKIETFEYDIVDELKNKKASIVDIANKNGTIETRKEETAKNNFNKIILIVLILTLTIALIIFLGLNLRSPKQAPPITQASFASSTFSTSQIRLEDILPITNINIGRFTSSVSKIDNGYSIKLSDFSSVYSYILQNEYTFGKELQGVFKISESTSTQTFKDITLSNQDMRVLTVNNNVIVYAFIGDSNLVLSTSTEGILTIRSVILSR